VAPDRPGTNGLRGGPSGYRAGASADPIDTVGQSPYCQSSSQPDYGHPDLKWQLHCGSPVKSPAKSLHKLDFPSAGQSAILNQSPMRAPVAFEEESAFESVNRAPIRRTATSMQHTTRGVNKHELACRVDPALAVGSRHCIRNNTEQFSPMHTSYTRDIG